MLRLKTDINHTDFAFGSNPHVRTKDSHTGSYNIMHGAFLKVTTGIFPYKVCDQIDRKDLAVMSMAAQIQINTGIRKLRQFPRFMIDDDNRLIRIQIPCNLFRGFPAGYTAPGTFIIRSAIKIKGIINQNTLILLPS